MRTSYIFLILSLILIAAVISLGGQNLSPDKNETFVQYELKLSSEQKKLEQVNFSEFEADSFSDDELDLEDWMADLSKWK